MNERKLYLLSESSNSLRIACVVDGRVLAVSTEDLSLLVTSWIS